MRLIVVEQAGPGNVGTGDVSSGGTDVVIPTGGSVNAGGDPTTPGGEPPSSAGSGGTGDVGIGGSGGMPDVPIWEAAPRYTASFTSYAFPGQHIQRVLDKSFIATIDLSSDTARRDATFDMIPGLFDKRCSSFRALDEPSFFRHAGSRIWMHAFQNEPLYLADATFCEEAGMADAEGVTFRSVNYPQRVIHLRNQNELWIDDIPNPVSPEFAAESTFYRQKPLYPAAP